MILNNNNLLKYITVLTNDPLSAPDVDISQVINQILLKPFDNSEIQTQGKIKIFLNPLEGDLRDLALGNNILTCDILVPNNTWIIEGQGQLRAFRIADEICQMIDYKTLAIGKAFITKYRVSKVNDNYSALTLFIKIDNVSIS